MRPYIVNHAGEQMNDDCQFNITGFSVNEAFTAPLYCMNCHYTYVAFMPEGREDIRKPFECVSCKKITSYLYYHNAAAFLN